MSNITTQTLLDARVHFGHMSKKWNPKMSKFILMKKTDLHIIDLNKTINCLSAACTYLKDLALAGKKIMFVGTKQQAKTIISTEAAKINMPYVTERWLGGTLTNFLALRKLIKKWQSFEKLISSPTYKNLTKKEQLTMLREKNKLSVLLGGLGDVSRLPSALFVVDVKKEHIAVREAITLGIPVIAMLDTNSDPDLVDLPIPSNDDSVSSIDLIIRTVVKSIDEGLQERLIIKQKELTIKEKEIATKVAAAKLNADSNTNLVTKEQKHSGDKITRVMTGAKTRPYSSSAIEKPKVGEARPKSSSNTIKQTIENKDNLIASVAKKTVTENKHTLKKTTENEIISQNVKQDSNKASHINLMVSKSKAITAKPQIRKTTPPKVADNSEATETKEAKKEK